MHILTASLADAQRVLAAALRAGFRESGGINLLDGKDGVATPIVAVRSHGLGLDSIIGYADEDDRLFSLANQQQLEVLLQVTNDRFQSNSERIIRFRDLLLAPPSNTAFTESKEERRSRKQAEGAEMQRRKQMERHDEIGAHGAPDEVHMMDSWL